MISDDDIVVVVFGDDVYPIYPLFSRRRLRLGGFVGPHILVRDDGGDLARRRGLDLGGGVSWHALDLQVSQVGHKGWLSVKHTRWKPFKFLWQVIWKTDADPCREILSSGTVPA